jgi:hypothetical protein
MEGCRRVIDSGCPLGEFNKANGLLIERAEAAGIPVIRPADMELVCGKDWGYVRA